MGLSLGACSIDVVTFLPSDALTDGASDAPAGDAPPAQVVLLVSAAQLTIGEGAQVAFTVALNARPIGPVTVSLSSSSADKLGVSPATVTFQPSDFATPRTITVTGKEDDDIADEQASITVQALGLVSATIGVAVNDNDGLGLVASPGATLEITEGTTETLGIRLSAQPAGEVIATLVSDNPAAATLTPTTLTFSPQSWDVEQLVTVSGPSDANTTDDLASIGIGGAGLADIAVAVKVFDDDVLGIEPSSTSLGALQEGAGRAFTVRLMQQPAAAVQVAVASSDPAVLTTAQGTLTFTTANWSTPQPVQVTSLHDDDTAGNFAAVLLTAQGLGARTVVSAIVDDDVQAITATPSPLAVGEGGTAGLDVRLAFRPATSVTLATSTLVSALATVSPASVTFAPGDYATAQRLTVTAMEDPDAAPGATSVRLEHLATGLRTDVAIQIDENDTLAIETTPASLTLAEGGTATFGVRLTAMPLADAIVNLSSSDPGAAIATPNPLFFNAGNWNAFQTVTVTGVEDADLAAESVTIALAASGLPTRTVPATISDNDAQQLVVSTTSVAVTEGSTASVNVSLRYQPAASVTVNAASSHAGSASVPASLTFTPTNYATPQALTITGVQDPNIVNETATITLSSTGIPSVAITASVTDNDTLAIETSVSSVTVGEGGTATFQVRLNAQPTAATTVNLASNDSSAATAAPASMTFTTGNWNTFQTATVTGVEDADVASETAAIVLSAAGLGNVNVGVTVTDNDTLQILTTTGAISLGEATTAGFGVRLNAQPAGNITVTVASADPGAATAAPATLTFTPASWNTDQPVTVTGVADVDVASETVAITCSSTGLTSRVVTASVTDDDAQAVVVTPGSVSVNEGGTTTFTVALQFQPAANVTVAVASSNLAIAAVSPASLTFTPANYATAQPVTVSGTPDDNATNESATITAAAPSATSGTVAVTVTDDDTLAIVVNPAAIPLPEGGSATFTVRLSAQPAATTAVACASGDPGGATTSPASLSFTTASWSSAQTVTVTGVQDPDLAGESVTITCSSAGLASRTVTATVTDDDAQAVLVSPTSLTVPEGATTSFGVSLQFQPAATVTVTVTSSNSAAASVNPTSLTFTPANYSTTQSVSVSGVQDANATPETATITAAAPGATSGTVTVTVTDDDTLAIVVNPISVTLPEGGSTTFTVRLSAQPAGATTVTCSSSDTGAATATPGSLGFTTSNWNTAQTVTVAGVQDLDLANESVAITCSSAGLTNQVVTAAISDDDVQAVLVNPTSVTVNEGSTTSFGVSLQFQPVGNVTIAVGSSNTAAASVSPPSLTFTPANYTTVQFVTVIGTQDANTTPETATITASASGATSGTVGVTVTDDDLQAIVTSTTSVSLGEGGSTTFTVRLAFQPAGTTTVTCSSGDTGAASVSPGSLSFTTANWSTNQTVTVSGVHDPDMANESVTITCSSSGLANRTVTAAVTDDDVPFCGDGVCNGGENSSTCPDDCGSCGDGVCSFEEALGCNCQIDCGLNCA